MHRLFAATSCTTSVLVWDRFVRLFHWATVMGFAGAYLSGEWKANERHLLIGYGLLVLWLARLLWGFIGTPHARFESWRTTPGDVRRYVQSLRTPHPLHYLGHNPLGALMVISLLTLLGAILFTGLLVAGAIEFEGPLLLLTRTFTDAQAYAVRDIHEALAALTLGLVVLHIAGAVTASIQHRENLILAMITGRKKTTQPSGENS